MKNDIEKLSPAKWIQIYQDENDYSENKKASYKIMMITHELKVFKIDLKTFEIEEIQDLSVCVSNKLNG